MNPMTDDTLISRILAGETHLYELLIRKYSQRLYRVGMSLLELEAETEEVMQTIFIDGYKKLSGFEQRSSFSPWLVKTMLHQCAELQQRSIRTRAHLGVYNIENMNTVVNEFANKELGNALQQAIDRLPEQYRLVFILRAIEEMSVRETCSILDIKEADLKMRLNRAKMLLCKDLDSYIKDYVYSFQLSRCDQLVDSVFDQLGISKSL